MTIQQVVAELENIKEQVLNDSKLTTDDMIEAIQDIISECKDNSMDFTYDDEDHYGDYERETDFTKLELQWSIKVRDENNWSLATRWLDSLYSVVSQ